MTMPLSAAIAELKNYMSSETWGINPCVSLACALSLNAERERLAGRVAALEAAIVHHCEENTSFDIDDAYGIERHADGWRAYFDQVNIDYAEGREIRSYPTAMEALNIAIESKGESK